MSNPPLSMARKHVLGDLYTRCEAIRENVPVFIGGGEGDPNCVGHVDQSLGHYADAFTFHLSPEVCKQLSAGYYSYSFEYEFADPEVQTRHGRIRLTSVSLIARQNYEKPIPRGLLRVADDKKDREGSPSRS